MIWLENFLTGAVFMGSFVAALFFLRFWWRTRDIFFLLFSCSFFIEAVTRFVFAFHPASDETEPLYYLPRLFAFALIILAVVLKNRPTNR